MVVDFFTITMSDTHFVRKKPTLQHAVKTLRTTQRDAHQYLGDKGFQVGERNEEDVFLGLMFKGRQPAADPVDPAPSSSCARNTNPLAKLKASDTKFDLIYKCVFADFL